MKKIYLAFLLPLILLFTGCGSEDEAKAVKKDVPNAFTKENKVVSQTYNLKTLDGQNITIKLDDNILTIPEYKNKTVLINFWATWCPPCIKEIPIFNELSEKYKDDFVIIGVLFEKDKSIEELKSFVKEHDIKFPVTISEKENFEMSKNFNVKKIPESFLYGKSGLFLEKYVGNENEKNIINYIKNDIK